MTERDLLTLSEAADLVGAHRSTLHRLVRIGRLTPALELGHMKYYARADIEALPPVRRGRPRREDTA